MMTMMVVTLISVACSHKTMVRACGAQEVVVNKWWWLFVASRVITLEGGGCNYILNHHLEA